MDHDPAVNDGTETESSPDPIERVASVLAANPDLTAAQIAEKADMAYSTLTPKLRALEEQGRAQRHRTDGRTIWRLTPTADNTTPPEDPAPSPTLAVASADLPCPPDTERDDSPADSVHAKVVDPDGAGAEEASTDPTDRDPHNNAASSDGPPHADTAAEDAPVADPIADAEADVAAAEEDHGDDDSPNGARQSEDDLPSGLPAENADSAAPTKPRRPKGRLRAEVLAVLQSNPDTAYKVSELSKQLSRASAGAIVNALTKLAAEADIVQTVEKPATYQAL